MSSMRITVIAAALLSAMTFTPVFAQAAIQEPGAFSFYYPNLDVLNGGACPRQQPACRRRRRKPMRRGKAASAAGALTASRQSLRVARRDTTKCTG
jgi:hypothetical protein